MKEIIYNYDLLDDKEINNEIQRVKALIINNKDEILFGYADKTYQFVGGHVEDGEDLITALKREVREESGINLDINYLTPFLKIKYYSRNYPKEDLNTITTNNYFIVRTDLEPNYSNRNLTEYEEEYGYTVKYLHKDKALQILKSSLTDAKKKNPVLDTIEAVSEFLKINADDTRRDEWR